MQRNNTLHREKKAKPPPDSFRQRLRYVSDESFDSFGRGVRFLQTRLLIPSDEAFERCVLAIPQFTAASNQQTLGIRTDALALQIIYGHIADLNVLTHLHDT